MGWIAAEHDLKEDVTTPVREPRAYVIDGPDTDGTYFTGKDEESVAHLVEKATKEDGRQSSEAKPGPFHGQAAFRPDFSRFPGDELGHRFAVKMALGAFAAQSPETVAKSPTFDALRDFMWNEAAANSRLRVVTARNGGNLNGRVAIGVTFGAQSIAAYVEVFGRIRWEIKAVRDPEDSFPLVSNATVVSEVEVKEGYQGALLAVVDPESVEKLPSSRNVGRGPADFKDQSYR